MKLGLFMMPSHPPERSLKAATEWDLQMIRWAEEFGYDEAWIGEHFTSEWEPIPSPDLIIAQALRETSRIRLGAGAHLLPFHHPSELAMRVAYMDHLSDGRLMLGVGSSGLPSDWKMFGVDGFSGQNRRMTAEALEIILKYWTERKPWDFKGEYWSASRVDTMFEVLGHHIEPLQNPHPPIGIAGLNSPSPTLELAGERGFLPMSLNLNEGYLKGHWESVEAGAARAGRTADRKDWRLVREIFVADTDKDAWEWSVESHLGRWATEYFIPLFGQFDFLKFWKHDQSVPDSEITKEYLANHNWVVGSVDSVVERLADLYQSIEGFGSVLSLAVDYADDPGPWRRSMELLGTEVFPRLRERFPDFEVGAS
jgi:alkanesulfonate monooxygenase SsuD/methylene tetrahydromethanopterin reductase-like flavin-dependent oxidoreductase (luciferase family)